MWFLCNAKLAWMADEPVLGRPEWRKSFILKSQKQVKKFVFLVLTNNLAEEPENYKFE